jgi:hypothetical protein
MVKEVIKILSNFFLFQKYATFYYKNWYYVCSTYGIKKNLHAAPAGRFDIILRLHHGGGEQLDTEHLQQAFHQVPPALAQDISILKQKTTTFRNSFYRNGNICKGETQTGSSSPHAGYLQTATGNDDIQKQLLHKMVTFA